MSPLRVSEQHTCYSLIDPQLRRADWNLSDRTPVGFEIPVDGYSEERRHPERSRRRFLIVDFWENFERFNMMKSKIETGAELLENNWFYLGLGWTGCC